MKGFVSGFKSSFNARALGGFAAVFVLMVLVAYFGWTPESTAARIRNATTGG